VGNFCSCIYHHVKVHLHFHINNRVIKSTKLPCHNVFVCVCTIVGLSKLTFKAHKFFLLQGYHEPFGDKALHIWYSLQKNCNHLFLTKVYIQKKVYQKKIYFLLELKFKNKIFMSSKVKEKKNLHLWIYYPINKDILSLFLGLIYSNNFSNIMIIHSKGLVIIKNKK